ncbi:MAG: hypothetical protein HZB65_00335 [Candidatus Aenigmarchaeota archaeon]|nr:hypothetical protein [Candidatus Aenigmarchaeota archaeon]
MLLKNDYNEIAKNGFTYLAPMFGVYDIKQPRIYFDVSKAVEDGIVAKDTSDDARSGGYLPTRDVILLFGLDVVKLEIAIIVIGEELGHFLYEMRKQENKYAVIFREKSIGHYIERIRKERLERETMHECIGFYSGLSFAQHSGCYDVIGISHRMNRKMFSFSEKLKRIKQKPNLNVSGIIDILFNDPHEIGYGIAHRLFEKFSDSRFKEVIDAYTLDDVKRLL